MGIRFLCPNGHKLNVKAFLAGKRGICPDCDAKFVVPFENGGRVEAIDENEPPPAPTPSATPTVPTPMGSGLASDLWHARTASGAQHGPATTSLMKSWIAEGKVDRDSWVWTTGWLDWQRASDVFPELGAVLEAAPILRPRSFVEESLAIQTEDDLLQGADVLSAHRRIQRQRKERIKSVTLFLAGMMFILLLVLLIVLLK
jgi:GYF domain 2